MDRSPFLREPGLDEPEEPVKSMSAKRSSSEPMSASGLGSPPGSPQPHSGTPLGLPSGLPQRPKKVHLLEDSYGLASDKYIKRFPHANSYKDYRDYKDDYTTSYGYRYNSYRAEPQYGGYPAGPSPFVSSPEAPEAQVQGVVREERSPCLYRAPITQRKNK